MNPVQSPASVDQLRAEDVERALCTSAWPTLRHIQVQTVDGVVTLTGYVRTYHEKQVARQHVLGIAGVCEVNDHVEVFYT